MPARSASVLLLASLLAGTALGADESSGSFALRIDEVAGLKEPWPLVGGLPFPRGAVRDPAAIRILGPDGTETPAQIDPVMVWPDGSLRWALAGFTAVPRGEFRVEFGPGLSRAPHPAPLVLTETPGGGLAVDTGAAVYEFSPDGLLPNRASLGDSPFLGAAGGGAYLVDQSGRLARVAGEGAEIESEILIAGPARAVLRREGWYVAPGGERVARARAWFYFAAGSPALRVTHSLVFTEDTNELWVRDYGLEFRTPAAPERVRFPLEGGEGDALRELAPGSGEAYLLQETYPHFQKEESRALVGLVASPGSLDSGDAPGETFAEGSVAGDWGEGDYGGHSLALVSPDLAQRFPKEIAFTAGAARAALWSGRGGRDLDFRAATLVRDLWGEWAEGAPGGTEALATHPSNAQGASRTHDLWLLPRPAGADPEQARAALRAASSPPLLQADPDWLCATMALGWETHPKDEIRFPEQEAVVSDFWEDLMARREARQPYGFIEWGRHPAIRGPNEFFRLSRLVDYGLRRHSWGLYARSGERRYRDYGHHFNRFAGDWEMADWDTGTKFRGGLAEGTNIHLPLYWGERSVLIGTNITGDDIGNWILEHVLTGDALAADRIDLTAAAFRERFAPAEIPELIRRIDSSFSYLRRMNLLHEWTGDPLFRDWAELWLEQLVDFEVPLAITDEIRLGPFYKTDRDLLYLYEYHLSTGSETARRALLQALDYHYRYGHIGLAYTGQAYPALLFAAGYRLTGNPDYLRVANYVMETGVGLRETGGGGVHVNFHPMHALPAGLAVLADVAGPVDPWPVVTLARETDSARLVFRKGAGEGGLEIRGTVWMEEAGQPPEALLQGLEGGSPVPAPAEATLRQEPELSFQPQGGHRADPRHWHLRLVLPAAAPEGLYLIDLPGAERFDVTNSAAAETSVYAPEGFRHRGDGVSDYFLVPEGLEELRVFLGTPMELRCPQGETVVAPERDQVGELVLPAAGRAGAWSLVATQPGVIRLDNAEPVFSRSPGWLVRGSGLEPAPRWTPPGEETGFVPGLEPGTQALHLPGERVLSFTRGSALGAAPSEGYERLPGAEGTIEFWYRPDWSAADLPVTPGRFLRRPFVRAGALELEFIRGQIAARTFQFASLNLWARGEESNAGFNGRHWFRAGEWRHVAACWRLKEGEPGTASEYHVFVDGMPVELDDPRRAYDHWPGGRSGGEPLRLREADETVLIGPIDGSLAQLRISSVARYNAPFDPPQTLPSPDADTRAQFALDGDFRDAVAGGEALEAEEAEDGGR